MRGPGIKSGHNPVLGTNVDYAPTWLAMAGIPTPETMDGRSILAQLIPEGALSAEDEAQMLPRPTLERLQADREELQTRPWRTEQFHQVSRRRTRTRTRARTRLHQHPHPHA